MSGALAAGTVTGAAVMAGGVVVAVEIGATRTNMVVGAKARVGGGAVVGAGSVVVVAVVVADVVGGARSEVPVDDVTTTIVVVVNRTGPPDAVTDAPHPASTTTEATMQPIWLDNLIVAPCCCPDSTTMVIGGAEASFQDRLNGPYLRIPPIIPDRTDCSL